MQTRKLEPNWNQAMVVIVHRDWVNMIVEMYEDGRDFVSIIEHLRRTGAHGVGIYNAFCVALNMGMGAGQLVFDWRPDLSDEEKTKLNTYLTNSIDSSVELRH